MRVCGECAWWDPNNDKESGDCCAPAPMSFWDLWDRQTMNADADATACPCFKARVCPRCGGTGKDDSVADRLSSDPIKPNGTPCPACHGNNAASRGKEEL